MSESNHDFGIDVNLINDMPAMSVGLPAPSGEMGATLDAALPSLQADIRGEAPSFAVDLSSNGEIEADLISEEEAIQAGFRPAAYKGADGRDGHSPYVDEDGYWWEYDDAEEEWVNTGIRTDPDAIERVAEAVRAANDAADDAKRAARDAEIATERSKSAAAEADAQANAARDAALQARQQTTAFLSTAKRNVKQMLTDAREAIDAANKSAQTADEAAMRAIAAAPKGRAVVVDALPDPSEMIEGVIYLVPSERKEKDDMYNEYMLVNGKPELLHSDPSDLIGIAAKDDGVTGILTEAHSSPAAAEKPAVEAAPQQRDTATSAPASGGESGNEAPAPDRFQLFVDALASAVCDAVDARMNYQTRDSPAKSTPCDRVSEDSVSPELLHRMRSAAGLCDR